MTPTTNPGAPFLARLLRPAWISRTLHRATDHRIIGFGYLLLSLIAVIIGSLLSLAMRMHLAWPNWQLPLHGPILPEEYLALVTMHGTLMLFFVLTVAPQSGFGNLILPSQLGTRRMAFPGMNGAGLYLTALALLVLLAAFFVPGGAPIGGWTAYPPLSATPLAGPGQGTGMDLWLASIALFAIGTTLSSINTLTTIVKLRCDGLTWERLPLTVWGWFTAALLSIMAFSVLLAIFTADSSSLRRTSSAAPSSNIAATAARSSGCISSGSSAIPRSTSPSFPAWASSPWSSPTSAAAESSPTA
jgi:heme/copper-type cytochrome/quinol oxidase subunit 1